MAKQNGSVIAKTGSSITIKYADDSLESLNIGKIFGTSEGSTYAHDLVSDLQIGDKFKQGDPVIYNTGFFERDWLDKTKIIFKFNKTASVALSMTNDVYEDSSAISSELSNDMSTTVTKSKSFVLEFKKHIINMIDENSSITPHDILFTVLDENTDQGNLTDNSILLLQNLTNLSPKAKLKGTLVRYEIKYNGDIADMSPNLRKLTNRLDKELYERTKGTEYSVNSGRVSGDYRVEGKNLQLDTLELKVFISLGLSANIGDKLVISSQLKSVIADVFTHSIRTESGLKVDALFGYVSLLNRVVLSPFIIGTTVKLTRHVSKQVVEIYFK